MKSMGLAGVLAAAGIAACTGTIDADDPAGSAAGTPGGSASDPASGTGPTFEPPAGCETKSGLAHLVVHRLNRVEYNNTIRDLLGNDSKPGDEFVSDDSDGTFDNNSVRLNVDTGLLRQLGGSAQRLAQQAVTQPGFISCNPAAAGAAACAKTVLDRFARRAWRRPVTAAESDGLLKLVDTGASGAAGATFADGMALAVEAVLASPYFLYRFEFPPSPAAKDPFALDPYALASRLSYFLWRSMPDDRLLAAAESGELSDGQGLATQVTRMLADKKASGMAEDLAGQWLSGRAIPGVAPDPIMFPQFDRALRTAIPMETYLYLKSFIQDNRDLRTLISGDFTFLNERLAQHYKIIDATVKGEAWKRVELGNHAQRGGLLTQATFLAATSKGTQPIIPRRGKWVLNNLLCGQTPPPPVDAVDRQKEIDKTLGTSPTRRQVSEARMATQPCGGCHARLDPIGLALDKYDVTGAWREKDGTQPIDVGRLKMPDGTPIQGPRPLERLLRDDPAVPACMASALFRYGLGRSLGNGDACLMADVTQTAMKTGFGARDLIAAIVGSQAFRFQGQ